MEEDCGQNKQSEYLEQVFKQYFKDKKLFFDDVYCKALSGLASGSIAVHTELMNLSDAVLNYSRTFEEEDEKVKELRSLSFVLRKISQSMFEKSKIENKEEYSDKRFLKLVS
jgi:hypothetical protein